MLACATTAPPPAPATGSEEARRAAARRWELLRRNGAVDPDLSTDPAFLVLHNPERAGEGVTCSDIDLFIYGLSPEATRDKVLHIYEVLWHNANARGSELFAARTEKAWCAAGGAGGADEEPGGMLAAHNVFL